MRYVNTLTGGRPAMDNENIFNCPTKKTKNVSETNWTPLEIYIFIFTGWNSFISGSIVPVFRLITALFMWQRRGCILWWWGARKEICKESSVAKRLLQLWNARNQGFFLLRLCSSVHEAPDTEYFIFVFYFIAYNVNLLLL